MALKLYEFFKHLDGLKTKKEKVEYLQNNRHISIDMLVSYVYNSTYKTGLPDSIPEYTKNDFDDFGAIHNELKRLGRTIINDAIKLPQYKKESIFIDSLEIAHKDDALLLEAILVNKLPFKTLKKPLFEEALPELFENEKV